MILKMEQGSTNSTVIKGSVSMALLSFNVTKDSGMALNQAVSQKVGILSEYSGAVVSLLFQTSYGS